MRLLSFWTLVAAASFSSPAVLCAQILDRPARPLAATPSEDAPPTAPASSLAGTLLDPSGAAIARAQVSLLASGDKAVAQTITDSVGSFHFDNLAPGNYILEFHAEGFRDARINTTLAVRRQSPLRVTLQIAVASETVTVATEISVPFVSTETSENQNANLIDRNALDRVPVFDQDYVTTMSRFLDDNATGTNGVTLVVNGIEANGPGVTPSAIQEVKINNNPYSERFSSPGHSRLEIAPKSRSSPFHGALNFLFRDSVFDARNAFAIVKPPERRQYYEGSITGPIGPSKRTSFLLALDEDLQDQQAVIDPEAVAAAESLGFGSFAQTVPNPTHHFFGSGRVFHDLASGDQFWIGYFYEHRSSDNSGV